MICYSHGRTERRIFRRDSRFCGAPVIMASSVHPYVKGEQSRNSHPHNPPASLSPTSDNVKVVTDLMAGRCTLLQNTEADINCPKSFFFFFSSLHLHLLALRPSVRPLVRTRVPNWESWDGYFVEFNIREYNEKIFEFLHKNNDILQKAAVHTFVHLQHNSLNIYRTNNVFNSSCWHERKRVSYL